METALNLKGEVEITLKRQSKIIEVRLFDNIITNLGLVVLVQAIIKSAGFVVNLGDIYIGVGTDEGAPGLPAPSPTDLTLANELLDIYIPRKKVQVGGISIQNNVAVFEVQFMPDEGNPNTGFKLTEAGLFWLGATLSRNTGVLVSRVLMIPPLAKNPSFDTLGIKWMYQIGRK